MNRPNVRCRGRAVSKLKALLVVWPMGTTMMAPAFAQPPSTAPATLPAAARTPATYHSYDALSASLRELVAKHPDVAHMEGIGQSVGKRRIWVLRLGLAGPSPLEQRPAFLLVAGLDGTHLVGSELALLLAGKLAEAAAAQDEAVTKLLTGHTIYVLPRVNPDAQESFFGSPQREQPWNHRPADEDRDRRVDEDGPEDINGDGLITLMRVPDPEGEYGVDAEQPRLIKKADRAKGETSLYKVIPEGIDDDGDGQVSEDGAGGVDLERNFPYRYPALEEGAGSHQLSEPETRAVLDFVLAHPHICVALTYGPRDNLVSPPSRSDTVKNDSEPTNPLEEDLPYFKQVSEKYLELTKCEKAEAPGMDGSFAGWAYYQFGIPSFVTFVWTRPKMEEKPTATAPADGAATQPAEQERPRRRLDRPRREEPESAGPSEARPRDMGEMREMFRAMRGRGPRPEAAPQPEKKEPEEKPDQAREWLRYSDEMRDKSGYLEWRPFEHPTLGRVEIGGFLPFFRTNPPAEELAGLADKQFEFFKYLAGLTPALAWTEVKAKKLAAGLYEVEAVLVNEGYFPTALAMGRESRQVRPVVVSLDVAAESIWGGPRLETIWSLPGKGGKKKFRWVVRAEVGQKIHLRVVHPKFGLPPRAVELPD